MVHYIKWNLSAAAIKTTDQYLRPPPFSHTPQNHNTQP